MVRAINRKGEEFELGEEIMMADSPILYPGMENQILTITEIKEYDACESGYMIQVVHKGTKNPFKNKLDTNWFKKIKS